MEISMDLFFCAKSGKVHGILAALLLAQVFDLCLTLVPLLYAPWPHFIRTLFGHDPNKVRTRSG
ncbi:Uncharacterised protein [Sphingobacterium daejeonense]|nr:Uncharacterised protein [Sphingobacterium daejeonense]